MATDCSSENGGLVNDWTTSVRKRPGKAKVLLKQRGKNTNELGDSAGEVGLTSEENDLAGRNSLTMDSDVQGLIGAPITWRSGPPLGKSQELSLVCLTSLA